MFPFNAGHPGRRLIVAIGTAGMLASAGTLLAAQARKPLAGRKPAGPSGTPKKPQATGVSIHHCSCNVGCPCMFGPQLTSCRMVMVHHIDRGTAHGKKLDGATVVAVYPSTADLKAKPSPKFEAAVYVDKRFPRATQELLVRIFTPSRVREKKRLLASPADISFTRTKGGFRTVVKGFVTAETTARTGRDNKQIVVHNVNFAEGTVWRVGESLKLTLNEPFAGWKWDMTGRNGTWTEWAWTGGNTPAPAVDPANPPRTTLDAHKEATAAACSCCGH